MWTHQEVKALLVWVGSSLLYCHIPKKHKFYECFFSFIYFQNKFPDRTVINNISHRKRKRSCNLIYIYLNFTSYGVYLENKGPENYTEILVFKFTSKVSKKKNGWRKILITAEKELFQITSSSMEFWNQSPLLFFVFFSFKVLSGAQD